MCTFLGVARVDLVKDETGDVIRGWNLCLAEPSDLPSIGFQSVKKWRTDERAAAIFNPYGGIPAYQKYAGKLVSVEVGLRGQVMGLSFPDEKK